MKIMSFTEARANFAKTLDSVVDDAEEVVIHRSGHEPVVVVSLAEWASIKETEYLLSDPANAKFLRDSAEQIKSGQTVTFDSLEELEKAANAARVLAQQRTA